jgi:hypothetical protein
MAQQKMGVCGNTNSSTTAQFFSVGATDHTQTTRKKQQQQQRMTHPTTNNQQPPTSTHQSVLFRKRSKHWIQGIRCHKLRGFGAWTSLIK